MKLRKWMTLAAAGCLMLGLTACGKGPTVYVQPVSKLMQYGGIAPGDRFGGMVVSEFVAEVEKDADKTVAELLVEEGQDVKEGEALFAYDTEELQLTLDKQKLELEQMRSSIESYQKQIEQLEKESNRVGGTDKLQFTVQIQTTQLDLKETELKIKTKEAEVKKSQDILEHAEVLSPVTGRVQAINESGTDNNGEPVPYITIQKSGAYRVKGILGELQRGGITEGSKVRILSRTDPDASWTGTVSLVDLENPVQDNRNHGMMEGGDEMAKASKYPFYVKLDSTEGLIMGQHVYLELDTGEDKGYEVALDGSFLVMDGDKAFVWAETGRGRLEKREVVLGEFDENTYLYEIREGLTGEDYIAFPDEAVCVEGAVTTHDYEELVQPEPEDPEIMDDGPDTGDLEIPEDISEEDLEQAAEDLETMSMDELEALAENLEGGD